MIENLILNNLNATKFLTYKNTNSSI